MFADGGERLDMDIHFGTASCVADLQRLIIGKTNNLTEECFDQYYGSDNADRSDDRACGGKVRFFSTSAYVPDEDQVCPLSSGHHREVAALPPSLKELPRRMLCIWDLDDTLVRPGSENIRQHRVIPEDQLYLLLRNIASCENCDVDHLILTQGSVADVFSTNPARQGALTCFLPFLKPTVAPAMETSVLANPVNTSNDAGRCGNGKPCKPLMDLPSEAPPDLVAFEEVASTLAKLKAPGHSLWRTKSHSSKESLPDLGKSSAKANDQRANIAALLNVFSCSRRGRTVAEKSMNSGGSQAHGDVADSESPLLEIVKGDPSLNWGPVRESEARGMVVSRPGSSPRYRRNSTRHRAHCQSMAASTDGYFSFNAIRITPLFDMESPGRQGGESERDILEEDLRRFKEKEGLDSVRWFIWRPGVRGISLSGNYCNVFPEETVAVLDGTQFRKIDVVWSLAKSGLWDRVVFIDNNMVEVGLTQPVSRPSPSPTKRSEALAWNALSNARVNVHGHDPKTKRDMQATGVISLGGPLLKLITALYTKNRINHELRKRVVPLAEELPRAVNVGEPSEATPASEPPMEGSIAPDSESRASNYSFGFDWPLDSDALAEVSDRVSSTTDTLSGDGAANSLPRQFAKEIAKIADGKTSVDEAAQLLARAIQRQKLSQPSSEVDLGGKGNEQAEGESVVERHVDVIICHYRMDEKEYSDIPRRESGATVESSLSTAPSRHTHPILPGNCGCEREDYERMLGAFRRSSVKIRNATDPIIVRQTLEVAMQEMNVPVRKRLTSISQEDVTKVLDELDAILDEVKWDEETLLIHSPESVRQQLLEKYLWILRGIPVVDHQYFGELATFLRPISITQNPISERSILAIRGALQRLRGRYPAYRTFIPKSTGSLTKLPGEKAFHIFATSSPAENPLIYKMKFRTEPVTGLQTDAAMPA